MGSPLPETLATLYTSGLVVSQYKQKKSILASKLEEFEPAEPALLRELCERFCAPPFPRGEGFATFWLEIWERLSSRGREDVVGLPDPCLNHLESRDRKPERSEPLRAGLRRIQGFEEQLFLDGLRLYPHELCRTAEAVGPLPEQLWRELSLELRVHRLWTVGEVRSEEELWQAAERLRLHRDLPQPLLDYLDLDRPKEKAPVSDFQDSVNRFILRRKIEQIRDITYRALREFDLNF